MVAARLGYNLKLRFPPKQQLPSIRQPHLWTLAALQQPDRFPEEAPAEDARQTAMGAKHMKAIDTLSRNALYMSKKYTDIATQCN